MKHRFDRSLAACQEPAQRRRNAATSSSPSTKPQFDSALVIHVIAAGANGEQFAESVDFYVA